MMFFFTLHEGDQPIQPEEAHEAHDVEDALRAAVEASRDIMSADIRDGRLSLTGFIIIENDQRVEVGRIHFRDALDSETGADP